MFISYGTETSSTVAMGACIRKQVTGALLLKKLTGMFHEMDIFLGLKFLIITFSIYADGLKIFQKAFHYTLQYTIINFLFSSLKLFTRSENAS